MAKIEIHCPTCSKKGNIEIDDKSLENSARGLLAVHIPIGTVCTHSFISFIDRNYAVRDYFVADFHIEMPQIESMEKINSIDIISKDVIDIDLIKLNVHAMTLTYVLKAIFLKQKIILISDYEFLYDHLFKFFNYITKSAFEFDISFVKEEEYKVNKKEYKNCIVIKEVEIIRNQKNIINQKKLYIEKQIVNKFFSTTELGYSYIFLKNEIGKCYELSKAIVDFIKEEKENKNLIKISKNLEERYHIKINPTYLNFLISIVENYFGLQVPSISESFFNAL